MKSNDELQRSNKMNAFLKTTEGQQLQAQYKIQTAEQAMQIITDRILKLENHETALRMMYHLALSELTQTIQRNENKLQNLR